MSLKKTVLGKELEVECRYHPFVSVKEGKMFWVQNSNNFHFCVFKVLQCKEILSISFMSFMRLYKLKF